MNAIQENETFEEASKRERIERIKRYEEIEAKIKQVAKLLGFKLEKKRDEEEFHDFWRSIVNGDEEISVTAYQYGQKDKISFRARYPEEANRRGIKAYEYKEKILDHISVSKDKSAEQIARDVERRLLGEYRARLASVKQKLQRAIEYENKQNDCIEYVSKKTGLKISNPENRNRKFIDLYFNGFNGKLEQYGDEEFSLDVNNLTKEQAVEILEILKRSKAKELS